MRSVTVGTALGSSREGAVAIAQSGEGLRPESHRATMYNGRRARDEASIVLSTRNRRSARDSARCDCDCDWQPVIYRCLRCPLPAATAIPPSQGVLVALASHHTALICRRLETPKGHAETAALQHSSTSSPTLPLRSSITTSPPARPLAPSRPAAAPQLDRVPAFRHSSQRPHRIALSNLA